MRAIRWTIPAVLATVTMLLYGTSLASSLPVPAMLYPPGAHIAYRPHLTNHQMDCMWGFICEGYVPNFHDVTQDQLNRTGGWGEFAALDRKGHERMAFELFASRYAPGPDQRGQPWSRAAFDDLRAALRNQGYTPLLAAPGRPVAGRVGGWLAEIQRSGPVDLVVMACWTGQSEVEAIAMYGHRSASDRRTALHLLRRQVRVAMAAQTP